MTPIEKGYMLKAVMSTAVVVMDQTSACSCLFVWYSHTHLVKLLSSFYKAVLLCNSRICYDQGNDHATLRGIGRNLSATLKEYANHVTWHVCTAGAVQ